MPFFSNDCNYYQYRVSCKLICQYELQNCCLEHNFGSASAEGQGCISSKVIAACVLWCDIFASLTNGCKSWLWRVWWGVQESGWASHCKTLKPLKEEETGWVRKADLDLGYTGFSLYFTVLDLDLTLMSPFLSPFCHSHIPMALAPFHPSCIDRGELPFTLKNGGYKKKIILLQCIDWRKYFNSKFK